MFKVLVFLESDLARIESELNAFSKTHDVSYVWNTGSRLVFILREKVQRGRPSKDNEG